MKKQRTKGEIINLSDHDKLINLISIHNEKEVNQLLESICLIRRHVKTDSKGMTIMVHDMDGGISGAACVIALYNLLQSVDECLNEKNEIKKSANDVEVFREVNKLRKMRANMIDTFGAYKMLYQCLGW